jgi:hypothetical protein
VKQLADSAGFRFCVPRGTDCQTAAIPHLSQSAVFIASPVIEDAELPGPRIRTWGTRLGFHVGHRLAVRQ